MTKRKKKCKSVLENHKQIGKKFIPPMRVAMGDKYVPINWLREVLPEFLWLALLIDQQTYRETVKCAIFLSEKANEAIQGKELKCGVSGFSCASDFNRFTDTQRRELLSLLSLDIREKLDQCLGSISKFYPEFPMKWLVSESWMTKSSAGMDELIEIKNAVQERVDRRSKKAMECQVLAWAMTCKSGKLLYPRNMEIPDPNLISDYPDSDDSQKMASHVRAAINSTFAIPKEKHN